MITPRRWTSGFTLLELLAVVAILGLMAAAAGMYFGRRGDAKLRQANETLLATDEWARRLAELQGTPVRLRIDVSDARLQVERPESGDDDPICVRTLARGIEIEEALTTRERRSRGDLTIDIGVDGRGDPYAVKLVSDRGPSRWVIFAGGSGQTIATASRTNNHNKKTSDEPSFRDRDVEAFFRALRKGGLDAH